MALAGRHNDAAFVPPLQLPGSDASKGNHITRCKETLHEKGRNVSNNSAWKCLKHFRRELDEVNKRFKLKRWTGKVPSRWFLGIPQTAADKMNNLQPVPFGRPGSGPLLAWAIGVFCSDGHPS